jgi:ribonuclease D
VLITTQKELDKLCASLAQEKVIAIDTEFVRRDTYYAKLSLLQISTKEKTSLVDVVNLNLELIKNLLLNQRVVKIFHAPRQDFEIFYHLFGITPVNIFDTQIAASICGLRAVMSYADLCSEICHVTIDKTYQAANWLARPLREDMLIYAAKDVEYLHDIYEYFYPLIEDREGYEARIQAELLDHELYKLNSQNAWKKIRAGKRSEDFINKLKVIAAFREETASNLDVPRGHFIPDQAVIQICSELPVNLKAFRRIQLQSKWMKMDLYRGKILDLCSALTGPGNF